MTRQDQTPAPRIELDLEGPGATSGSPSRRGRPTFQPPPQALPRIEPVLGEGDIGRDEAERTVGYFLLASALPGVLSMAAGRGSVGLLGIALPIYLGVGLLRGDDFAKQWVFAACLAQLVIGPLTFMISPGSWLFIAGGLVQNLGLLVLVSGKALSRPVFRCCLAAVALGVLLGALGALAR